MLGGRSEANLLTLGSATALFSRKLCLLQNFFGSFQSGVDEVPFVEKSVSCCDDPAAAVLARLGVLMLAKAP